MNDLERPVFEKFVFLAETKRWLLQQPEVGAALMSGSGSTVFAVLRTGADAEKLAERARAELDPKCGRMRARRWRAPRRRRREVRDTTPKAFASRQARVPRSFTGALLHFCPCIFAVQLRNKTGADLGRTNCFAFVGVGAVAETFRIHRLHHSQERVGCVPLRPVAARRDAKLSPK